MCNPRRLQVRLTREVSREWTAEIARAAQLSEEVRGEANATVDITADFSAELREEFERVIATAPGWTADGGSYVLDGTRAGVRYHPASGELQLSVVEAEVVRAVGQASRSLAGRVTRQIEESAASVYLPDEDELMSEDEVRETITGQATAGLDEQERALDESLRQAAQVDAERQRAQLEWQAQDEADRMATQRLRETSERRRGELADAARARLDDLRSMGMSAVQELVMRSVREMVLTFARQRGGTVLIDDEAGGLLSMELEVDV